MGKKYKSPDITESIKLGSRFKYLDYGEVENLAAIGMTNEEIASWFGMTRQGLHKRMYGKPTETEPDLVDALQRGRAKIRQSLRRAQVLSALDGNTTMLIWLGKQMLGQRNEPRGNEAAEEEPELVLLSGQSIIRVAPGSSIADMRRAALGPEEKDPDNGE